MKKEKVIIIKSPQLRRARCELRPFLKLWKSSISSTLIDEWSFYIENDLEEKALQIRKKMSDLDLMFRLSICYCGFCGRNNQDMIYIPDLRQWICLECNSERVYFEKSKSELLSQMSIDSIIEFLERLAGEEGISLTRSGSRCNGYTASKRILDKIGLSKEIQDKFLELYHYYGGDCDCEILLNAKSQLLSLG